MNTFASNLLAKREEKRLTQVYMAFLSGMSQPNYSDIERGKTRPSIDQLKKFSEILEVSVDELISDVKIKKSPRDPDVPEIPKGKQSALIRVMEEKDSYIKMLERQLDDLRRREQ